MDVAARLDRLERELRRWRWGAATVAVLTLAGLAVGAGKGPAEVRATRFVVEDSKGKEKVTIGPGGDAGNQYYALRIIGEDGRVRVFLSGEAKTAILALTPGDDETTATFTTSSEPVGATLQLQSRTSRVRLMTPQNEKSREPVAYFVPASSEKPIASWPAPTRK